jgi:SulP family sulfate permease
MHVQMSDFIPFLSWIRTYNQRHVKADLLAGLTVAVVAVPQCMAYALIAGLVRALRRNCAGHYWFLMGKLGSTDHRSYHRNLTGGAK